MRDDGATPIDMFANVGTELLRYPRTTSVHEAVLISEWCSPLRRRMFCKIAIQSAVFRIKLLNILNDHAR